MSSRNYESTTVRYEIQVAGHLEPDRIEWLGNPTGTLEHTPEGTPVTQLAGELADQAALFGLLNRIRDAGLRLITVSANARPLDS